jgi:DNA transformation protein
VSRKNEFKDFVEEILAPLGQIRCRAMFGGFGVYCNDYFVAIIVDDVLFFKADDTTNQHFLDEGCRPFEYEGRDGRKMSMSYYEVPSSALDSSEAIAPWLTLALKAAKRSQTKKKTTGRKMK